MLKILPIILFHSAHKIYQFDYALCIDYAIFSVDITRFIKFLLFFIINNIILGTQAQ